jgi:PAS domain S-box-containing protein
LSEVEVGRSDAARARPAEEGALELAVLVDSLSEVVLSNGLDGTIHGWNEGAVRLFGYEAQEIVGKPVTALAAPERAGEIEGLLACVRRGETITEFETVRRRKDGADVHVSLNITPVRSASGEIVGASVVAFDIGKRRRREEIQRFLTEASRLLAINLDYRETLSRVADLMVSNMADWCTVETAGPEGSFNQVAVAHRDPAKAELAREMRRLYPPAAARPDIPLRVLTTGRAELVPEVSDALLKNIALNDDHLRMLRELAPGSLIVVPLRTRERVLGTILLANSQAARRFGPDDLELAEDLGRRAALAIDNATLHRLEQEARLAAERTADRIGRLQAVTAALSGAVTPAAVADVLASQGAAAVGADGGFVRLLSADGTRLELQAAVGYGEEFEQLYRSLPVTSPLPGPEVFRTGTERYFESAAAVAASSEFAREQVVTRHEAMAFVPLLGRDGPIGSMALSFAGRRTFDEEDKVFLRTLADQCGQALERARLYEAERQARAAAELAVERTARLQLLAAELAEALTPAEVAEVVVTQGIASVNAEAGALQLLTEEGTMLEVVCGHGPNRALIEQGWLRFSVDLKLPGNDALRRFEPVFIESEEDIRDRYPDVETYPHGMDTQAGLRARAGVHIPLIVSGRPLGVLFLGFTKPRRFSTSQRSFVLALGRQCAQALKRAQLYEAELEERSRLSRLVERLHEGVVSVDRQGHVAFASSKAKQMLSAASLDEGRRVPESWLGFSLRTFVTDLFEADGEIVEAQVVSRDGARVFDVTGIPAARSESALLVVTDVSEREQRRRAEREFVDNAAHELRTPLAAITSSIERLQAGARDIPEKRDRFLGHIQNESTRLNRLASSLLVLARAQTREEEPRREPLALCALVEELTGGLEPRPGVDLVLDCTPQLVAWSNRDLLEHALVNLAGNAVHHTDAGTIRISTRAKGDCVEIEVCDTGAGIAPEEIPRLFDRFYRGPTEKGRAGVGLGLPITKDAVEALGGRVEIESTLGVGTTARIVLPGAAMKVPA